jgi:hypothetical protein
MPKIGQDSLFLGSSWRFLTLAFVLCLTAIAAGPEVAPVWSFAIAPIVNGDSADSGILFDFRNPPKGLDTVLVAVDGSNDGKALHLRATLATAPQSHERPGVNLLRVPGGIKSAEVLKLDQITIACAGRKTVTVEKPRMDQAYQYCGAAE